MMNYEIFKKAVTEKILDYMPEEYQNMKVRVTSVNKVNRVLDGLHLVDNNAKRNVSPTIYINDMYKYYVNTENLYKVLEDAADAIVNGFKNAPTFDTFDEAPLEDAKDNIVFQLINTEQNKELLNEVPHKAFHDLSIIYRLVIENDERGIQSTIIHNSLAEQLELSEEQLFELAIKNTRRILPPVVRSMNDVIREIFMKDGMPAEMADMMIQEMPADKIMYIINNEQGINGAGSMLYEDLLYNLAEELETDLYVLPSSIHECIAVSVSIGNPNELASMVADINMEQVALEERLSNQVYHYDKDLRVLTLATDTPNKRLDAVV